MKPLNCLRSILTLGLLSICMSLTQVANATGGACIDIVKKVSVDGGLTYYDANTEAEAITVTNGAIYRIIVAICDGELKDILVSDDILGVYESLPDMQYKVGTQSQSIYIDAPNICENHYGTLVNTATVTATGIDPITSSLSFVTDSDDAWVRCDTQTSGGEGCTPGYWKQPQHLDSWPAVVTPDTLYSTVFGREITIRTGDGEVIDPTLLQALSALGGKVNTAARHSTAAYLNAITSDVSYDLSADQIIDNLQQSVDSSDFGTLIEALVNFNEQGCPLN